MMLDDGNYDAIVVDAEDRGDGVIAMEIAIASGPRRGEVVTVVATNMDVDAIDLLALPATLIVDGGEPRVTIDG